MNTRKLTLTVSVFLVISTMTTISANAGIVDWFKSNRAQAEEASSGSFDSMYASVMSSSNLNDELPNVTAHAVTAVNSPVGGVQTTLRRTYFVQVSAYNSEVGQTDDSPFITANGTHVRDGIVAANIISTSGRNIPFNTAMKFKNCGSIAEDKIFIVTDRLNKRYTKNVDIWMEHKADAIKFGRRTCQIEVI